MMKKKIVYVTDLPLIESDAPSIHVIEVCKGLSNLGNDVLLIAPKIKKIRKTNFRLKYIYSTKKFIIVLFQPIMFFYLLSLIFKKNLDIIYVRQSPFLFIPFFVGKLFKKSVIVEVNGTQEEEIKIYNQSIFFKLFLKFKILFLIEKMQYSLASNIIVVTQGLKTYISNKYKLKNKKIVVVNNGVNSDFFKPLESKKTSQVVQLDRKYTYIGYIGGITEWQGIAYIIEAATLVTKKFPRTKFLLVGDGDYKFKMKRLIKVKGLEKKIIIRDRVHHSKVPYYINSLTICLSFPTKVRSGITSPFKIYEYLSCGKAVVVSDIDGVGDMFRSVAVVAKAEDHIDLASKIESILSNRKKCIKLEIESRKFILTGNSWNNVCTRLNQIIDRSINA